MKMKKFSLPFSLALVGLTAISSLADAQAEIADRPKTGLKLSQTQATKLAVELANDECERLYKKRPFTLKRIHAVQHNDRYRWGRLDVTGQGGFSSLVTFALDGSDPKVEVFFSTDQRHFPGRLGLEP